MNPPLRRPRDRRLARSAAPAGAALAALLLGGCASAPATPSASDPLGGYNRAMFAINEKVDQAVVRPVAVEYRKITPSPVRRGVGNFFGNMTDAWSAANDLMQLHFGQAAPDILRVEVNTVFGVFGLIDIASEMGLYRHPNDFGLTLARWGVGSGPYIVLPLFGPSTLRDATGTVVHAVYDPSLQLSNNTQTRDAMLVLNTVNQRANLLSTTDLLQQIALDPYLFTRDAYLQRRRAQVRATRDTSVLGTEPRMDGGGQGGGALLPAAAPAPAARTAAVRGVPGS